MAEILRNAPNFSPLSEQAGRLRPGQKLLCSRDAQWQSLLVQIYQQPNSVDAFETVASPDQLVVFVLKGQYEIESLSSGLWKRAAYRPGVGGLTAAMTSNRLRWHSPCSEKPELLRIYIPQSYFEEVYDEYRRVGASSIVRVPDTLAFLTRAWETKTGQLWLRRHVA